MRFKRLLFLLCILLSTPGFAGNGFAIRTVVIDAGHGGKDPGAIGANKTNEKDIALAVALKLGDYIQKNFPDVTVIYTRKIDTFLELHERAEMANQKKADLFICIHCNSSPSPQTYGTSTYVLGLHRTEANLEVAKRENSVILLEDDRDKNYEFDPNTPEGHIIMSMKQNAFLDQSIDIASKIENEFENYAKRKSLGVRQAGFYVPKTTMPSILSEIGFISNPQEEKFLNSATGQDEIANALLKAFSDYKFEVENSKGEQVAYQEAKKKSESRDTLLPKTITTSSPGAGKAEKQENKTEKNVIPTPAPTAGTQVNTSKSTPMDSVNTQADLTVVMLSGRRIRKPIENASGGGTAEIPTPKVEPPVVKEVKPDATEPSIKKPVSDTTVTAVKPAPVSKTKVLTTTSVSDSANKARQPETKTEVKATPRPPKNEPKPPVPVKTEPKEKVSPSPETKSSITKASDIPAHKPENGNVFKVQLFAVTVLKNAEFQKISKLFPQLSTELLPSGIVRYFAGDSKSYSGARETLQIAVSHGYADAFIIGFKDGVRMTPNQLKAQEKP